MGEEHPPANQRMGLMSSHFFEPLQQGVIDPFRAELDDEFIIVNRRLFAILCHGALHVPRRDYLFVGLGLRGVGGCFRSGVDSNHINWR